MRLLCHTSPPRYTRNRQEAIIVPYHHNLTSLSLSLAHSILLSSFFCIIIIIMATTNGGTTTTTSPNDTQTTHLRRPPTTGHYARYGATPPLASSEHLGGSRQYWRDMILCDTTKRDDDFEQKPALTAVCSLGFFVCLFVLVHNSSTGASMMDSSVPFCWLREWAVEAYPPRTFSLRPLRGVWPVPFPWPR